MTKANSMHGLIMPISLAPSTPLRMRIVRLLLLQALQSSYDRRWHFLKVSTHMKEI